MRDPRTVTSPISSDDKRSVTVRWHTRGVNPKMLYIILKSMAWGQSNNARAFQDRNWNQGIQVSGHRDQSESRLEDGEFSLESQLRRVTAPEESSYFVYFTVRAFNAFPPYITMIRDLIDAGNWTLTNEGTDSKTGEVGWGPSKTAGVLQIKTEVRLSRYPGASRMRIIQDRGRPPTS
jgi:hypothetical protein